jgi:hypothetical protein
VLQARSYNGEFPTRIVGRHRVVDRHNVPLLLKVFELTPADQDEMLEEVAA